MSFSDLDYHWMSRALELAEQGRYTTRPNPRVGCVITHNNELVSEGWHYRAGEAHAEIHALQQAGDNAHGATVYVTLEPCAHQGRTGACADALIKAGVARVVYAMEDPNPLVAGKGLSKLCEAGIEVDGPLLKEQAEALNPGFIKRMREQKPWVSCKTAISIDGRTAMASGESQWITGIESRRDVQRLRAQSCAVVTGIGSILQDDSRLSVRQDELLIDQVDDVLANPPLRVVLDSRLQVNGDAAIFKTDDKVIVFTSQPSNSTQALELLQQHQQLSIETINTQNNSLDLAEVLDVLAQKYQCNEVLVEAGATLISACIQANIVDELMVYQAPILMGSSARPLAQLSLEHMSDKVEFTMTDCCQFGDDLRITYQPLKK